MTRLIIIFIAFIMMTIGISYLIIYINLFSFGYTIKEYITFIIKRPEIYLVVFGFLIEILSVLTMKGKKK